jgi:hypothetical protein
MSKPTIECGKQKEAQFSEQNVKKGIDTEVMRWGSSMFQISRDAKFQA